MMNLKDSLQIDEIFFSNVFHLNRMNFSNTGSTEMIFDIFFSFQVVGIIIGALGIAVIAAIGDVDAKIQNISFVKSVLIAML